MLSNFPWERRKKISIDWLLIGHNCLSGKSSHFMIFCSNTQPFYFIICQSRFLSFSGQSISLTRSWSMENQGKLATVSIPQSQHSMFFLLIRSPQVNLLQSRILRPRLLPVEGFHNWTLVSGNPCGNIGGGKIEAKIVQIWYVESCGVWTNVLDYICWVLNI